MLPFPLSYNCILFTAPQYFLTNVFLWIMFVFFVINICDSMTLYCNRLTVWLDLTNSKELLYKISFIIARSTMSIINFLIYFITVLFILLFQLYRAQSVVTNNQLRDINSNLWVISYLLFLTYLFVNIIIYLLSLPKSYDI